MASPPDNFVKGCTEMKYINLRFFDGEPAASEGGEPEHVISQDGATGQQPDSGGESGIPEYPEEDYSAFDKKSPLLMPGRSDEEGTEPAEPEPAENTDAPTEPAQQTQQQPYRVLKHNGHEIPVQTEEELMSLASKGLDYTVKTQRIAPYRALIEKLDRNPSLMAQVVGLVNGSGVPPQSQPQYPPQRNARPQPARPTGGNEPSPGENETWDDYMARRAAWQDSQDGGQPPQQGTQEVSPTAPDFMSQFNAAMELHDRQATALRVAKLTANDPKCMDVLNVIATEVPQSIQAAMNADPVSYQMVYDQIRRNITGEAYFSELGRPRQPQPQQQAVGGGLRGETVVLKGGSKPPAPVVESGRGQKVPGTGGAKGINGLPNDVWGMDDTAFSRLMERSLNSR